MHHRRNMYRRRRNPSVRLGPEFFQAAKKDYREWKEKWWREVIQNSVDAGSTEIECFAKLNDADDIWTVSCTDNGKGMSEDVLLNKFLVLGATTKKGEGASVGGFGKAKELIILPWIGWEIHTRGIKAVGQGAEYEVYPADEYLDGTRVTVKMTSDYDGHTNIAAAKAFLKKCYIPQVTFKCNGEVVEANLTGELVKEFDEFNVYYNQEESFVNNRIFVRTNGIFMFSSYIDRLEGSVMVEIIKPSIEILTANREGFREWDIKRKYERFVGTLMKDVRSGLMGGNRVRKIYRSGKKFETFRDDLALNLADQIARRGMTKRKDDFTISTEGIEMISETAQEIKEELADEAIEVEVATPGGLVPVAESTISGPALEQQLVASLLQNISVAGEETLQNIVQQLSWEPDFYVVNEVKDFEVPAKFYPETMSSRVRKLARMWAEICRFVFIQLGSPQTFGIGFIFSFTPGVGYTTAEYIREDGENWLLLNPYKGGDPTGRMLTLSSPDDLDYMYARAIHEATHVVDNINYHDEDFAGAITDNIGKCLRGRKNLKSIRDAISRYFRDEAPPAPRAAGSLKEKPQQGMSYYVVKKPGRGRKPMFVSLAEARAYVDESNFADPVEITAWVWDRNGKQEIASLEWRYQGNSSRRDQDQLTIEDQLRYLQGKMEYIVGIDVDRPFYRNPKKKKRRKRRRR